MLTIQDKVILKRKVYLQNGQQAIKTYKLVRFRYKSQTTQIYDVYDSELTQQLTLKIMIKNQQLSKQKSINEIKNQQLFVGLPNFISLYDIYQDNEKIFLVMEKWGDTLANLTSQRLSLTEFEVQLVFSQLVDIVVELRKANIAHNFITLESLYIDLKQKNKLKLGDFKKSFNVASYFQTLTPQQKPSTSNLQKKAKQAHMQDELHQKLTPYSSPEQVSPSNIHHDYTTFLTNLYQNDIWNIGIILFRLLMGRFPFDYDQGDQLKYAFDVFTNKKDYEAIHKKECCFTFYEKHDTYSEPVSMQFKQLIKSILKPVHKRITLTDLLSHPLKLQSYHNLTDLNFQHHLPPLMNANLPIYTPLKPLKAFLFQHYLISRQIEQLQEEENRWNSNPRHLQSKSNFFHKQTPKHTPDDTSEFYTKSHKKNHNQSNQNDTPHNHTHFLSPKANFSLFSVFNDDKPIFPFDNQQKSYKSAAQEKYHYTWNLNFAQTPQLTTEVSIAGPITQTELKPVSTQKVSSSGKTASRIKGDNYELQSQINDNLSSQNEKENNEIKTYVKTPKRLPSANFHKPTAKLNPQFNIRNLNSKKNLGHSNLFSDKKPTFDKPEYNYQTSSIALDPNPYTSSLSNSRLTSKKLTHHSHAQSLKIGNKKYQDKSDEICQIEQNAESISCAFNSNKKNEYPSNKRHFLQLRQAQLLILRNQVQSFPLLVQQPEFVLQYKFKKIQNSLGYVLNNGVGVIFDSGKQVIGHNQNDFVIVKKDMKINDSPPYQTKKDSKYSFNLRSLTSTEIQIYQEYLKLFGKRMVISNFSIWIHKFWRMGRVFVFLLNNGSWQVTLEGKKTSKFFIIDENQLIWSKGKVNPEVLNEVRKIVNKKREEIMQEEYYFK